MVLDRGNGEVMSSWIEQPLTIAGSGLPKAKKSLITELDHARGARVRFYFPDTIFPTQSANPFSPSLHECSTGKGIQDVVWLAALPLFVGWCDTRRLILPLEKHVERKTQKILAAAIS
jgi:hypothetical protein